MWECRMFITTYSGGRVKTTRYHVERKTRHEVESVVMNTMGREVIGLYKPDSGERVAFDLVVREVLQSKKGYMIGAELEEGIIDITPEDDVATPHQLPGSIVI